MYIQKVNAVAELYSFGDQVIMNKWNICEHIVLQSFHILTFYKTLVFKYVHLQKHWSAASATRFRATETMLAETMLAETVLADLRARAARVCWCKGTGCTTKKIHV